MKIYFAGSIRGADADRDIYSEIIECLKKYGEVLTEHVGSKAIARIGEQNISVERIFKRDLEFIRQADVFVADVSVPSLGVGYEIGKAEELGKKILCICNLKTGRHLSAMVAGNKNLMVKEYKNLEEVKTIISEFLR